MKISAGDYHRFYDPSVGEDKPWYINDHCIIRGEDGWHLFGITHAEPAAPLDELCCAHALGTSLSDTAWKKLPFPIVTEQDRGEAHFWAPHVIFHEGLYYMFWCAGNPDGHDRYQIMEAVSTDLYHWERIAGNPIVVDGFDARDPMVLRVGDEWVLYYTATSAPDGGNHIVACVTSRDLIHWGNRRVVFTDPSEGTYGGPTESPFVVRRNEMYYLFIGPRGDYNACYNRTEVFESADPFAFSIENKVGELPAHAAEVIEDDGQYYTTRAGWGEGGVYIAGLNFEE
ncbi:MAG: family 43 glycosylhydrolase [Clostridia bacterium]|nr:family 43 glycosylhydrolase [Clostridia bacterium]